MDFINNFMFFNGWLLYHWELLWFSFSWEVRKKLFFYVGWLQPSAVSNKYCMSDIWALHLTVTKILLLAEPEVLLDEKPTVLTSKHVKCLFMMKYLKNNPSILAKNNFGSSADHAKAPADRLQHLVYWITQPTLVITLQDLYYLFIMQEESNSLYYSRYT